MSRIYLDNIDHITAYWVSMGLPLAQVSLGYGVDDLHGTIMEEKSSTWRARKRRSNRPWNRSVTSSARPGAIPSSATAITIISRRRSWVRGPARRRTPRANSSAPEVQAPASLRLGCVKYLNALPLIHGWRGEVQFEDPATLCRQLGAGALDVALVSSFEYLRHPIYAVVDGLSIASDGPVYSVILAHRGPLARLREVVVDPASETSVKLLRCLLGEWNLPTQFVREGELSEERGLLLIGDQAIRFREEAEGKCQLFDLGAEWKKMTGLPFVFALWMARPDYAGKAAIAAALRSLGQDNLARLDRIIATQPEKRRAFCEFYFRDCLRFSLGDEEKKVSRCLLNYAQNTSWSRPFRPLRRSFEAKAADRHLGLELFSLARRFLSAEASPQT